MAVFDGLSTAANNWEIVLAFATAKASFAAMNTSAAVKSTNGGPLWYGTLKTVDHRLVIFLSLGFMLYTSLPSRSLINAWYASFGLPSL